MTEKKTLDFALTRRHAKALDIASLIYTIKDCVEASRAMADIGNDDQYGYYCDEASTYRKELRDRDKKRYTLADINRLLDETVGDCKLEKGDGYFFFTGQYNIPSIYAGTVAELSISEIISEAMKARANYIEWMQFEREWGTLLLS